MFKNKFTIIYQMSQKYTFGPINTKPASNANQLPVTPMGSNKYTTYYQFCQQKNPYSKKYETRKVIFTQNGEIARFFESDYSARDIEKFVACHSSNKYAFHSADSISMIGMPNASDWLVAASDLTQ
jgi:hypothetical protein